MVFLYSEEEKQQLLTNQFSKSSKNYLRGLYLLIKGDSVERNISIWIEIWLQNEKSCEENLIPFNDANSKAFINDYHENENCQANSRKIIKL
jgi:hypothetical protein